MISIDKEEGVKVLTIRIQFIDREIERLRLCINEMQATIESTRVNSRALRMDTALEAIAIELDRHINLMEEELATMRDMLRALERIRMTYMQTENTLIDNAEESGARIRRVEIGNIDVSKIVADVNAIRTAIDSSIRKMD